MYIQQLAQQTSLSTQTIRYYESIGLLPPPQRAANNYRDYPPEAVQLLCFIAGARGLGYSLEDIAEFLAARGAGRAPCQRVLDTIDNRLTELDQRIADLLALRESLEAVRRAGQSLPPEKRSDSECVCYLLTVGPDTRQITIQPTTVEGNNLNVQQPPHTSGLRSHRN